LRFDTCICEDLTPGEKNAGRDTGGKNPHYIRRTGTGVVNRKLSVTDHTQYSDQHRGASGVHTIAKSMRCRKDKKTDTGHSTQLTEYEMEENKQDSVDTSMQRSSKSSSNSTMLL